MQNLIVLTINQAVKNYLIKEENKRITRAFLNILLS